MLLILVIMAVLLADLGIKSVIEERDPSEFPKELEGSKGLIMLHRNHNRGFAMGMLEDRPEAVKTIPLMVVSAAAGIFLWIFPRKGQGMQKLSMALILGGGLSNLYDRVKRGYVVDYFSIRLKGIRKIVFNLGDFCIFLGTGILIVAELLDMMREH